MMRKLIAIFVNLSTGEQNHGTFIFQGTDNPHMNYMATVIDANIHYSYYCLNISIKVLHKTIKRENCQNQANEPCLPWWHL